MTGKTPALPFLVLLALLLTVTPSRAEEEPAGWFDSAVAAGEIDRAAYHERMAQIVSDLNAMRRDLAGVGELVWDMEASEGHFRHARWLLHHMKEPWNSGGVTDFHDETDGSEFFHAKGRTAAGPSLIAFKYLDRRGPFEPCDRFLPTVVQRLPLLLRSAKTVYAGYAEGIVPKGAQFAGEKWAVVVLATDAEFGDTRSREDAANREPVVCPRDGAGNVPLELLRESPDIVPKELDGDHGKEAKHGFPLTFSFFGGQALLTGAEVELVALEEVVLEEDKPERHPPGRGGKKKKKTPTKPKTEIVETPVDCHVSTPVERPLRERPGTNANSVVVIPHRPLEPDTTYRATLTCRTGTLGGDPETVELVTTFKTVAK